MGFVHYGLFSNPFGVVFAVFVVVVNGVDDVQVETLSSANSTAAGNATSDDDDDDDYYNYEYTIHEVRTVAYLAKPFALFSIVCSYVMIREVVADLRSDCGTSVTRTLLSLATADILFSFATFLGMWPIPSSYGDDDDLIIGNVGNQASCTFQGFMWTLGYVASCLFNASLSILYLLIVRYSWINAQLRKLEPWQQGSIWITALAVALYPIPLKMYTPDTDQCALFCFEDECAPHILALTLVPWVCFATILVAMGMLLCTVRSLENKSRKYCGPAVTASPSTNRDEPASSSIVTRIVGSIRRSDRRSNRENAETGSIAEEALQVNRRKSTAVAMQGLCYALAFVMTYFLELISAVWWLATNRGNSVLDDFAYRILLPSMGTFNFLVFARTRTTMKSAEGKLLRCVMCCSCFQRWAAQGAPTSDDANEEQRAKYTSQAKASVDADNSAVSATDATNQSVVDEHTDKVKVAIESLHFCPASGE